MGKRIMIVSESTGVVVSSIVKNLQQLQYLVIITATKESVDVMLQEKPEVVLICSDETMLDKLSDLEWVKNKAVVRNIPIFQLSYRAEVKEMEHVIPSQYIKKLYVHPYNVQELVADIDIQVKRAANKKKILVVDDSGAMLRNVKGWLENKYQVILANSGAMAIKYLSNEQPDLVLLDYEMPVLNGKQLLEVMRSETDFSKIPVIFLTGKGDKESVMEVMSLKPAGYLLKTMPPEQIIHAVDEFFEKNNK